MINIKVIGAFELASKLSEGIKDPLSEAIKRITLQLERETKMATPVDTGRLRGSITHEIGLFEGIVGTNVEYAPYVEYGTKKMSARHMEGVFKAYGTGMFTYAIEQTEQWMGEQEDKFIDAIELKLV